MIITFQIDVEKASKEQLEFLAQMTTDCEVLAELAKSPYLGVVLEVASSKYTSSKTLDALAKDLASCHTFVKNEKVAIFTSILTNDNCGQDTIRYILTLDEYRKIEIYDSGKYDYMAQYALDKVNYIALNTIEYLFENNKVYPEMIIKHFRDMEFDNNGATEILEKLKKWLPVENFGILPRFVEFVLIGLAQNTNFRSYQIEALLQYINENILSKQILFSEGRRTEMFYSFAANERTGKNALNYLATIDDMKIRDAILKNSNAPAALKKTLRDIGRLKF